jgi:hypothetical protein
VRRSTTQEAKAGLRHLWRSTVDDHEWQVDQLNWAKDEATEVFMIGLTTKPREMGKGGICAENEKIPWQDLHGEVLRRDAPLDGRFAAG